MAIVTRYFSTTGAGAADGTIVMSSPIVNKELTLTPKRVRQENVKNK